MLHSFGDPSNEPWGGTYSYSGNDLNGSEIRALRTSKGGTNEFVTKFTILNKIEQADQCELDGMSFNKAYLQVADYYENYCNVYNVLKATGIKIDSFKVVEGSCSSVPKYPELICGNSSKNKDKNKPVIITKDKDSDQHKVVDDKVAADVPVYFGAGCFWHFQHEFLSAERELLKRSDE